VNEKFLQEINLIEHYFEKLKFPQDFVNGTSFFSLKNLLEKLEIVYYSLIPCDGNIYDLNVVGKRNSIKRMSIILESCANHFQNLNEKDNELKFVRGKIEELKKKYGKMLFK